MDLSQKLTCVVNKPFSFQDISVPFESTEGFPVHSLKLLLYFPILVNAIIRQMRVDLLNCVAWCKTSLQSASWQAENVNLNDVKDGAKGSFSKNAKIIF